MNDLDATASEKTKHLASAFSGTEEERVAVLGAFDTWSYMDYVCHLLAENNYVAMTSRWIYRKFGNRILRFDIKEDPNFASNEFLSSLLDQIISTSKSAVINYSVSAAHFIETDWCYNKSKKTLGIAYVRSAFDRFEDCCKCLNVVTTPVGEYSECKPLSQRTAWQCMRESAFCPFTKQDISKNVIEYFFRSDKMKLVAVENLKILPHVIKNELPPMPPSRSDVMSVLGDDIIKFHESVFRKHAIFIMLLVQSLLKKNVLNRASKMKLWALAEVIPGHNIAKTRQLAKLAATQYVRAIKKGYVDHQIVADRCKEEWFNYCLNELQRTGLLEGLLVEFLPKRNAQLIRLSKVGSKFVDFVNNAL